MEEELKQCDVCKDSATQTYEESYLLIGSNGGMRQTMRLVHRCAAHPHTGDATKLIYQ
jgi:hypothetical protein